MAVRIITRLLTIIGGLVVFSLLVGFLFALQQRSRSGIPDKTILEADFSAGLIEYVPADPLARSMLRRSTLLGTIDALERAAEDERVVALIARVGNGFSYPASVQELREAIANFRSKGKLAVAFAENIGPGSSGSINYYLASAFDEFYLQPIGEVGFSGLGLQNYFLRGAFDKYGVLPQMDHREDYKSAKSIYTETGFTEADRESLSRIVESWFEQMTADIGVARGLSPEALGALADQGGLRGEAAVEAKLVDRLAFRDEVYAEVKQRMGEGAELLFLGAYGARVEPPNEDAETIALVYAVGGVSSGRSRFDPISGSLSMGSDSVGEALRAAARDEDVKAILIRVNSPGGSAVASQAMWRETLQARAKGKPVIVSMGDLAASGGYYIAMGADKIVAQPATITGSIGVVSGKLVVRELSERLGVTWDRVQTSTNTSMWSAVNDFTPEQWERLQSDLDAIYRTFTQGVADGRGLPLETVLEVAKGRVWTGADALRVGLVDELGGFPTALRLAREAAGIAEDAEVRLQPYPPPKSIAELVLARLRGEQRSNSEEAEIGGGLDEVDAVGALVARAVEALRPLGRAAHDVGLLRSDHGLADGALRTRLFELNP